MIAGDNIARERGSKNALLSVILISYVMIVLDISIVITGLPEIQAELGFSTTGLSWVQNAYTLTFGGLLLLGARAGDLWGRKRVFTIGLAIFSVASLCIGLAPTATIMIIARAIQGVGAAILAPSTLALLSTSFAEGRERTRAVNLYAAAAGVGSSLGLVVGGLFAGLLSWRVGFFMNVPIGIALIVAARRYIVESRRQPGKLDLPGAIGSTTGMAALVFGLVRAAALGWGDAMALAALASGLVILALFVSHERRAAQPIMPLRLFASRERAAAYAARVLFLGGMVGFWFFTTQTLQRMLGFSPQAAGLAFLPTTIPNFFMALTVPALTARFGNTRVLMAGLLISATGLAWLSQATAEGGYIAGIALPMILIGIGQGGTLGPLTAAGIAGVPPQDAGAASGLVNAAHQLGGSLGLGILVTVFAAAAATGDVSGGTQHQIGAALEVASAMLALALILVALLIPPKPLPHYNAKRLRG
jgi:EmrB/QacA subfamily drug resistance transporter